MTRSKPRRHPIGALVLSHGSLADELLTAARIIAGELEGFGAVSLDWSDGFNEAHAKIGAAIELLDRGDGVLILTDMFGGTPCNVALTFLDPGRVEIVTGVNLPMVVRLACLGRREMPVAEVAAWLREKGRSSICLASDIQSHRCPPPGPCAEPADTSTAEGGAGAGTPVGAGRGDGG
jgi:PTS system mannose-specific IIA component